MLAEVMLATLETALWLRAPANPICICHSNELYDAYRREIGYFEDLMN
ncbi:hypothetical protein LOZ80_30305 [Paenibacillus sp. HWE-109]|nr:hypothetical protein [Paenibacillus sp. HWE-109]UKS25811.1 hypothetical protein LOZ80_30305 [Paenibacillus sp. HWE-109]